MKMTWCGNGDSRDPHEWGGHNHCPGASGTGTHGFEEEPLQWFGLGGDAGGTGAIEESPR